MLRKMRHEVTKHILALSILTIVVLGSVFFIHKKTECGTNVTGIQHTVIAVAFETELQPFLDNTQEIDTCSANGITYHLLSHNGTEFVVFQTGVGPENAKTRTHKALKTLSIESLIFSGIAGSIYTDYAIGTTLVAREWLSLETGEIVAVDQTLLEKARDMDTVEIVSLGATSPVFVTDIKNIPKNVSLVDMETFEIARIAQEEGVPFIAFRSISDMADGKESDNDFSYAAIQNSGRVLEFLNK